MNLFLVNNPIVSFALSSLFPANRVAPAKDLCWPHPVCLFVVCQLKANGPLTPMRMREVWLRPCFKIMSQTGRAPAAERSPAMTITTWCIPMRDLVRFMVFVTHGKLCWNGDVVRSKSRFPHHTEESCIDDDIFLTNPQQRIEFSSCFLSFFFGLIKNIVIVVFKWLLIWTTDSKSPYDFIMTAKIAFLAGNPYSDQSKRAYR